MIALGDDASPSPGMSKGPPAITAVASTSPIRHPAASPASCPGDNPRSRQNQSHDPPFFYRSIQWTADGTTILASTSNNDLNVHVLPEDLLSPEYRHHPHHLQPQTRLKFSEPSYALVPAPYFSLSDPLSQTVLVSCKDHPIQLHHLFPEPESGPDDAVGPGSSQLASYKLIRRETEAYISAESMLWSWPGTHFLVGSANRLDYFDISRTGSDGPILTIPTIPSKRHISGATGGMKGTVSALSNQGPSVTETPLTAAGTWTRWLGLYDLTRSNKPAANWSIQGVVEREFGRRDDGAGIVQTIWSPCGRYLAINERQASGILVYDVRGAGRPLSLLVGRDAASQQRLSCDVYASSLDSGRFELWAGSRDGKVLVWEGVGTQQGIVDPSWDFKAHESPVGGTALHPGGSVVATCSGAWTPPSDEEVDERFGDSCEDDNRPTLPSTRITPDCNLNIWTLESGDCKEASQPDDDRPLSPIDTHTNG